MKNPEDPSKPFSQRHGYRNERPEITIWDDAPNALRSTAINTFIEIYNYSPSVLRDIACQILDKRPKTNNWPQYSSHVKQEATSLIYDCDWFHVYDIIEAIAQYLQEESPHNEDIFTKEINDCLIDMGVGWILKNGLIQARGEESFETIINQTKDTLEESKMPTAQSELIEALNDLSRRPEPDLTGAIHHSMSALECVTRRLTSQPNATLGKIIADNKHLFPKPLDEVMSKAWGYASEHARHGREDRCVSREEAQLLVGLVSSMSMYLVQKINKEKPE